MKLNELPRSCNICAIGDSGTGKTRLGGTLCALMPTVVVTADANGLETLVGQGQNPQVVLIKDWNNIWEYHEEVLAAYAAGAQALFIDDFGKAQGQMIRKTELKAGEYEKNKLEERRGALMRGDRRLILPQFGEIATATEAWLYEVLTSPFRVKLVTVLQEARDDLRTGEDRLYPSLTGALRYEFLSYFSLVLATSVEYEEDKPYFVYTSKPHPKLGSKDRYGEPRTWASTWADPTAQRILKHLSRREGDGDRETALEKRIGTGLKRAQTVKR